jgi:hypothetical protein
VAAGLSLAATPAVVAAGCGEGVVRLFDLHTLHYRATLPLPAPRGGHGRTTPTGVHPSVPSLILL